MKVKSKIKAGDVSRVGAVCKQIFPEYKGCKHCCEGAYLNEEAAASQCKNICLGNK